ncbi:peptidoglycan-binding domain-containing protein [Streptomyces sp. NPDC127038]|uniref:peptidoglycan-binding domain-containing protein n=1 Tax=Streptomyces sp. NPDC127038 TaxID=3347114 RepID=UPI0036508414
MSRDAKNFLGRVVCGAAAAVAVMSLSAGPASAVVGASYVGDGHSKNAHAVWCVQHLVNDYRRRAGSAAIAEDSVWGRQTRDAVYDFQANTDNSGPADGVVGPLTGRGLLNYDATDIYAGHGYCFDYLPTPAGF